MSTATPDTQAIQGITEDDIANYLVNTPAFFERYALLLDSVQLVSPHGARAVSLQQRQMEMLRDRIKGLEKRIIDMIRHAHDNTRLVDHLHDWALSLMLVTDRAQLPEVMTRGLKDLFLIPHAAVKVWEVDASLQQAPFAQGISEEVKQFARGLSQSFCGANTGFEAALWCAQPKPVEPAAAAKSSDAATTDSASSTNASSNTANSNNAGDPSKADVDDAAPQDAPPAAPPATVPGTAEHVASLAMVPLRRTNGDAIGLLVLASPDATRYTADMGTDLLDRIGELASAAVSRLLPPEAS